MCKHTDGACPASAGRLHCKRPPPAAGRAGTCMQCLHSALAVQAPRGGGLAMQALGRHLQCKHYRGRRGVVICWVDWTLKDSGGVTSLLSGQTGRHAVHVGSCRACFCCVTRCHSWPSCQALPPKAARQARVTRKGIRRHEPRRTAQRPRVSRHVPPRKHP